MPSNDLISRKALLENYDLKNATKYGNKTKEQCHKSYSTLMLYEIAEMIKDAPAVDAVEVVRCKDCKFLKPLETMPGYRYCMALKDVINFGDDFYCARGAKMED
jgi:hypothetical protein